MSNSHRDSRLPNTKVSPSKYKILSISSGKSLSTKSRANTIGDQPFVSKSPKKGAEIMATSPTQIRIDSNVKTEANELFKELGIDMSSAVNIFLRQCVLHGGLPFKVEIPKFNAETLAAMEEARDIMSGKIQATSYNTTDELFKDM